MVSLKLLSACRRVDVNNAPDYNSNEFDTSPTTGKVNNKAFSSFKVIIRVAFMLISEIT